MFVGWSSVALAQRNVLVSALYVATSFAHEAVVVFFVLSGFLVAGPNIGRARLGLFHPRSYGIDRLTRIYVTIIPALLFTIAADAVGRSAFRWTGFFDGSNRLVQERFSAAFVSDSVSTLAANIAMLQPIHAPVLGSNVPLWSLSYEVWFYAWFGIVAVAIQRRRHMLLGVIAAALGLFLFHWSALFGLSIWCLGALAYQGDRWPRSILLALVAIGLSLGLSMWGRVSVESMPFKLSDLPLGVSFAWLLALMKRRSYRLWNGSEKPNQALSNFSYSLYVIHFPTMLCFVALYMQLAGLAGTIKQGNAPDARALLVYFATAASTAIVAFLFSRLFEARTALVRRRMKDAF
jgi:peptidoglycan/LPS O-acetylase OafA/YrhL